MLDLIDFSPAKNVRKNVVSVFDEIEDTFFVRILRAF